MKSFKKLFAIVATAAMLSQLVPTASFAAGFSDELQGAYEYAYGMGITTQGSIDSANMYGTLIRSHMAKMMVAYAKEAGQTVDTSVEVNFTDIADQSAELQTAIKEAAQMGLMGLNSDGSVATKFNPTGVVTRAQFGTVLDRVINGDANNGSEPYYAAHLSALKAAGIMTNISTPNANEVRGYVMLMMQRADEGTSTATCSTAENILACTLGTSACPAECKDAVVSPEANGSLSVKLATSNGMDVPYGIPSLEVATYKFTATEDVRIDSVVLERVGYSAADTLSAASLFVNGGRISKIATSFNSDDQATVSITNGYTVKAGQTVEIAVNVAVSTAAAGDQFAIKIVSVGSTAKDVNLGSVTSDTFKVLSTANASIAYANGNSVEQPKVGSTSDLFDFKLSAPTQNATVKSITFKDGSGSIDEAADLENFKLVVDGETVAATAKLSGKYLVFNIADGYQIEKTKSATFTVKADVVGGANETINFTLENVMDLVVMGDTYDVPMTITGTIGYTLPTTVSAGKVALTRVNTTAGDLIQNKDNVFLGAFTVTNNADQSLNLEDLALTITGSEALDNVKVKLGSTTASPVDLTVAGNVWSEQDLGKAIGSKLTVYVYGDTKDVPMSGSLKMALTSIRVIENVNDTEIIDITPKTLSWTTINGQTSNGSLTQVSLADKTVSEGTEDVEAIQFKIKAGEAYGTKIKQITFDSTVDSDTISAATLYNGTTAIPTTIKSNAIVVDQDFSIAAGTTATLTLKVNVATNPEATTIKYVLSGAKIDAVDLSSSADDVILGGTVNGRTITVTDKGDVISTFEASATNNKYAKDVLAGNSAVVAEYSVYSKYETANVGSGLVTFSNDMSGSVLDVQLYYGSELVASNPEWSTDGKTAIFSDIDFDTATAKTALTVKVISKTIDQDAGAIALNTTVNSVVLGDIRGNDSGEDIDNESITGAAKAFNIIPVTIVPAVTTIGTTLGNVSFTANNGSNTTSGGDEAVASLKTLTFTIDGNNGGLTALTIKDDAGTVVGTATVTGSTAVATIHDLSDLSNGATTTLTVAAVVSGSINTPSYNVSLSAINYGTNVDATTANANFGAAKNVLSK